MIVQALVQHYEALAARDLIPRVGWCNEKVSYALSLSENGELLQIIPLLLQETRGKKTVDVPQQLCVPERVVRSSGVKANFLCDTTSYLLGFDTKGKPARSRECFEDSKMLHLRLLEGLESVASRAIQAFFQRWKPEEAQSHPAVLPHRDKLITANLVFFVNGDYAHEDVSIVHAWDAFCSLEEEDTRIRCLITGAHAPFARIHGKIKMAGAQSAGANLISNNADAFESYLKVGNQNSPLGRYAAFAHTTVLNHLLDDRAHRITLGDDTVVYWSQDASEQAQDMFSLFAKPDIEEGHALEEVIKRLEEGKYAQDPLLSQRFYILCLSPNAARISVRFFLQDSFGNILKNCARHYKQMEIIRPAFDAWEHISPYFLLQETVNPNSREKKSTPLLGGAVLYSILSGARYPAALYAAVFARIRAEQHVTRGRAAILKAFLLRNTNYTQKEGVSVALNENACHPAYILGRLFATLEYLQEHANPGINTTIKDRYFTSACTTPGSVFPTLLRLSQHHTAKLNAPGYVVFFEKQIGELLNRITIGEEENPAPFPTQLDLNEQGLFILGYYHQVQHRYKKKEEN